MTTREAAVKIVALLFEGEARPRNPVAEVEAILREAIDTLEVEAPAPDRPMR
jgi:hypothetical protein